jgi:hypothetical protein
MSRPTPETDAQGYGDGLHPWVATDFARKLEQERDEARENCKSIVDKANELIARWDQPSWKDTAPTARYINALRIAVRAYERQKP